MRTIGLGVTDPRRLRVYFDVRLLDGITPALAEAGGQPQTSINGIGWNPVGIAPLIAEGFGRYYADLNPAIVTSVGDSIETRYKGASTAETPGDTFQVIDEISTQQSMAGAIAVAAYLDVSEAEFYFENRLNSQTWDNAIDSDKQKALRHATRIIDRLNFAGDKSDPNQLLQFPRGTIVLNPYFSNILNGGPQILSDLRDTEVPSDIKMACCEIAFSLLDGIDPEQEIIALMADSQGYANVKTAYNRKFVPAHYLAGVPSAIAWTFLVPYLRDPRELSVLRAN